MSSASKARSTIATSFSAITRSRPTRRSALAYRAPAVSSPSTPCTAPTQLRKPDSRHRSFGTGRIAALQKIHRDNHPAVAYILRMRTKLQEGDVAEKSRPERRFVFLLNVAQRRLQRWIAAQAPDSGA